MLNHILDIFKTCTYDFRKFSYKDDPLSHLFDEWEDYYKLKWSIAKAIQPKSILEIGVRYGYSAITFLDASPKASFTGIDLNIDHFGGEVDAIDWAKKITEEYDSKFVIADSQEMDEFPGTFYDLIHVDGAQNGDSTYNDLKKAILQGRFILVDGYFWTQENFLSSSTFIKDYKFLIEYCFIIPGYAGELLIKVDEQKVKEYCKARKEKNSLAIKNLYHSDYYLENCGGFQEYKQGIGKALLYPRLSTLFMLSDVQTGQHVLDAGCGRGEISYACAVTGATVDAVDYSESAIDLSRKYFENETEIAKQVNFSCADITKFQPSKKVDRVIAGDLIEHLSPNELDILYENISQNLSKDGAFIIHSFPNLWFYEYGYKRKRRKVAELGGYLSPQPRSYYEQVMHINEQSPRVLKKQLEKHFKYVLLWLASSEEPIGSLNKKYSISDCINSSDLYALASNQPIDLDQVRARLSQPILTGDERSKITCSVEQSHLEMERDTRTTLQVSVSNDNSFPIRSVGETAIHLSYHWLKDDEIYHFEGERTTLWPILLGDSITDIHCHVLTPEKPGLYVLQITFVQETVQWFDADTALCLQVQVN